jgi:CIC family chloride channel protein
MAATFGASTRATFTAIVFAFELTRDYNAIVPLMLATVVAELVSAALLDDGLMTEKLTRRGLTVPRAYEPDVLRSTPVSRVMTTDVQTIPATATVGDAKRCFQDGRHSAYPVVEDGGRLTGIVTPGDVMSDVPEDAPVEKIASETVVTVAPEANLSTVLEQLMEEGVDHVPVVDGDGRLAGICTRTDILRGRRERIALDRQEPGWRRRTRALSPESHR